MLLDTIEKNAVALRVAGREAIARAKRLGVAAYYEDPSLGEGIIKDMPDGTLLRITVEDGQEVVLETLRGPR